MDNQNQNSQDPLRRPVSPEPPVYNPPTQPVQARPQVTVSEEQRFIREQVGDPDKIKTPRFRTEKWQSFFGFFGVIQLLVAALLLALVINQFIFQSYQVFGESMSPTLHQGNRLIISKLGKTWNKITRDDYIPGRGEVIVFKSPISSDQQLVKRVVGLPGETVEVKNGEITVYNIDQPEGFNPDELVDVDFQDYTPGDINLTVGQNELFVAGDNRLPNASLDSRNDLGLVPAENVIGTLIMRIFPLSDASFY